MVQTGINQQENVEKDINGCNFIEMERGEPSKFDPRFAEKLCADNSGPDISNLAAPGYDLTAPRMQMLMHSHYSVAHAFVQAVEIINRGGTEGEIVESSRSR
ncbi:hypothetical protein AAF712_010569 [Marasmius tenuissimus]|uniref:Uncharacterized protein n=1 Tax=Marasmius tenuissimus TaxID=585030 RepID=A0ABR2ZMI3_9AGAR